MSETIHRVETPFEAPEEAVEPEVTETPAVEETPVPEPATPEVEAAPDTTQEVPEVESLEIPEAAQDVLTAAGLDLNEFTAEFTENGNLGDESFAKLEAAGLPRPLVEQFVQGTLALQNQAQSYVQNTVHGAVGGQQNYEAMTAWAGANLNAQEIAAFNAAVTSMDPAQAGLAVSGLQARYNAANGSAGTTVQGSASAQSTADVYENRAALQKDLSSPEYNSSPQYRAKVEAKLSRSMGHHGGSLPQ